MSQCMSHDTLSELPSDLHSRIYSHLGEFHFRAAQHNHDIRVLFVRIYIYAITVLAGHLRLIAALGAQ